MWTGDTCETAPTKPAGDDATIAVKLSGEGLWDWINTNLEKFRAAFTSDVARMIDVEEKFILNVEAKLAESDKLLAATQSVAVSFHLSGNASSTESAYQLGKRFEKAVNEDDALFTACEVSSGVTITAKVLGVTNGTSDSAAAAAAEKEAGDVAIVISVLAFLCCCAGAAWWSMRQPVKEEAKGVDEEDIMFNDNQAAHRGPEGRASSLAGRMDKGGRGLESTPKSTSDSVELGEVDLFEGMEKPAGDRNLRLGKSTSGARVSA
jgi:hypothetical protein